MAAATATAGRSASSSPTPESAPASSTLAPFTFPSTWKASLSHWWSSTPTDGYTAQKALVQRGLAGSGIPIQDYEDNTASSSTSASSQGKVARMRRIDLGGGKERVLNVLEVGSPERKAGEHTFVVLHGYGGAYGFYWQNFKAFCGFPNTRVYFMDMLGMGLSGRPRFPSIKTKGDPSTPDNVKSRVTQAEAFFLDSFEDFAKKEQLSSFTMVGHSMGGYLSTAYALKYPERVKKLVLVSPVGIPKSPYHNDEEEEAKIGEARAGLDAQLEQGGETQKSPNSSGTSTPNGTSKPKAPSSWWTRAWEMNISPFSVVRLSSFAGPKLVSNYAQRRFALFDAPVQQDLFSYLYSVYGQRGSGEYCLAHILSPGAYARWPLIKRMQELDKSMPVTFVYGGNDWMDVKGGREACEILKNREGVAAIVKKRSKVYINEHAGHWVMLDNPGGFDRIIKEVMQNALDD